MKRSAAAQVIVIGRRPMRLLLSSADLCGQLGRDRRTPGHKSPFSSSVDLGGRTLSPPLNDTRGGLAPAEWPAEWSQFLAPRGGHNDENPRQFAAQLVWILSRRLRRRRRRRVRPRPRPRRRLPLPRGGTQTRRSVARVRHTLARAPSSRFQTLLSSPSPSSSSSSSLLPRERGALERRRTRGRTRETLLIGHGEICRYPSLLSL